MPSFNAEIAFKALEKRVDRIDTLLTAIEKQVKVLVETRGASKEKAVEELLKTLPAMHEADKKLQANVSLLAAQMKKESDDFARLGAAAQAALSKDVDAAQKEQEAALKALEKELDTRWQAELAQGRKLTEQLVQAQIKQQEAATQNLIKENDRLSRALEERVRMEASFDAKIAALRAQVLGLENAVRVLSK